jgi:TolB-like protein
MAPGLFQDLLKRRVPQILGIYLAVGWGVLEFVDWLIGRYEVTPRLADVSLVAWVAMIPTVLLLAYFHGARGQQRWKRVEKVGVPVNTIVAVALIIIVLSRGGLRPEAPAIDAAGLAPTRIAVLYFDDESEGQSLGHLANTFTGALIDELTQVGALDVVPRGAVKPYRDATVPLDSLARALGMGTLVEGSVSGSVESLTLSVTLIDPASQSTIESFALDGTVDEWRDLRDDLAAQIARRLRQRLGVEVALRERRAATESARALALYEQAERLYDEFERFRADGDSAAALRELARADSLLAVAESLDPGWVEPVVRRGWWAYDGASFSKTGPGSVRADELLGALAHAERALALAPDDPGALELHGYLLFEMSEDPDLADPTELHETAERELRQAVTADPFRASAWAALSNLHRVKARPLEARRDAERALEADPFLSDAELIIFRLYESSLDLQEIDEAVRWCDEGHRRFPEADWAVGCSVFLMALSGGPEPDADRAWALVDSMQILAVPQQREQRRLVGNAWAAAVLARAGEADSAASAIERTRAETAGGLTPWIDYYGANVWLLIGNREKALEWLGAFLEAIPQRKEYVASDWMFEDLWDDPRFKELVEATE